MSFVQDVSNFARTRKFYVALAAGLVVVLTNYFGEDTLVVDSVVALLAALGVYATPNEG